MKKMIAILLILSCIMLTSCNASAPNPERHVYDPEERTESIADSSDMLSASLSVPDSMRFQSMVASADLIIAGTVANDGETQFAPIFEETPDGPKTSITTYQINVREVLYGSCEDSQITLKLYWDYQMRPFKDDELILFLYRQIPGFYTAVTADNASIFAINPPDNKLFSFSAEEAFTLFDGKELDHLKTAIQAELNELSLLEDYPYPLNDVGLSALTPESPLYEKYEKAIEKMNAVK